MDYTFTVNGTTYPGRDSLDGEVPARCQQNQTCTLTYLPSDPRINCLGSAQKRWQNHERTAQTIAVSLLVLCAFSLVIIEIRSRGELRLAQRGEVTLGHVVEKPTVEFENSTSYRLRYRVETPDGVSRTGCVTISRRLWDWLQIGSTITVLYDPDHPRRHRPTFGFRFVQFQLEN